MTSVDVKNVRGEVVGSLELDDRVFGVVPNKAVVHQAVVAQLANQRKGTADTKTRGEVRGGTHKMWRQKGTGRARQGDRRAPHWVGGGVVFGPHPRSYHQDLPRKMKRIAMRSALSSLLSEAAVTVIDEFAIPAAKTREVQGFLTALGLTRGALIVLGERDELVSRASKNLPDVRAVTPGSLNLLDVLKFRHLILTRAAVEAITSKLLAEITRGKDVATEGGAAVPMEEAAIAGVDAGAPADVAVADAASDVASPDEDTKEGA
jgi:large subunit ribosomal protein L4